MSTSPSDAQGSGDGPIRPLVALAFAVIGFVALFVCGLGIASLVLNQDPISAPGFGQLPGILGSIAAAAAFAGGLWASLSRPHPSFWGALWTTAATFLGYLIGVGVGALIEGADPGTAAAAIGRLATTWFGAVIAAAALIAGWGGIALVRTRARRPRWPWERDDEEE